MESNAKLFILHNMLSASQRLTEHAQLHRRPVLTHGVFDVDVDTFVTMNLDGRADTSLLSWRFWRNRGV